MSNNSNLIQTRYVLAILNVARASDRTTAAKLVESLTSEQPHPQSSTEVRHARQHAMDLIAKLAATLQEYRASDRAWDLATDAVEAWEELVQRRPELKRTSYLDASL